MVAETVTPPEYPHWQVTLKWLSDYAETEKEIDSFIVEAATPLEAFHIAKHIFMAVWEERHGSEFYGYLIHISTIQYDKNEWFATKTHRPMPRKDVLVVAVPYPPEGGEPDPPFRCMARHVSGVWFESWHGEELYDVLAFRFLPICPEHPEAF